MKKFIIILAAILSMNAAVQAKTVKATFKVGGNCAELCKPRIEKAAKQTAGVISATWNQKDQMMSLVYDNEKTNVNKVEKAIAATGHDAGRVKASSAAYNKLPGCCQYRKTTAKKVVKKMNMKMDNNMKGMKM
ncbi:MAG: ATPase [Prevotella sp.]